MRAFVFGLKLTSALIVCLTVPIALAIAIGHAQPLPELGLNAASEACPQPCWHMIQVGSADPIDAWHTLQRDQAVHDLVRNDPNPIFHCALTWALTTVYQPDPELTGCLIDFPGQPVSAIELRSVSDTILLGDLFTTFGDPVAAQLCQRLDLGQRYYNVVFALIVFPNQINVLAYNLDPDDWYVKPTMRVKLIHYDQMLLLSSDAVNQNRWHGFGGIGSYGNTCDF